MADEKIFLKNGYVIAEMSGKEKLMVKTIEEASLPTFFNWEKKLAEQKGLTMLYSCQCPWVARFIEEVKPVLKEMNIEAEIVQLKTAEEAQKAPSIYAVFNLIYNGKLLSDRYISVTRFKNILTKEQLIG